MLKGFTGASNKPDAAIAGQEAAAKIKQGLPQAKVAFVYSGVQYDQAALLGAIAETLPDVPLIGNTSFTGVITPEGFITGDDGFVGILAVGGDDLTIGAAGLAKQGDARSTGQAVAKKALEAAGKSSTGKIDVPDYFYMVAPPGEEEFYLKGIEDIIGRIPFFGGSAADNTITGEWLLFQDQMVTADGVAVAFFYTDEPFTNLFTGAYEETTNVGIITKLDGKRTLVEIDGEPALKKYAAWTGKVADELKGGALLAESITAPLGVKDRLGDLVAIRHPMNGNDDYSINLGNNLAVGTAIIQMQGSVDGLIKSTGTTLDELKKKHGTPAGALHLVHCGGRRAAIDSRIDEVVSEIKAAAGDMPFIVEFTFGEYGYEDDGNNTCGGLMLSFSAM